MPEEARKVLVVGASGFLGRHLSRALLSAGRQVRCSARNPVRIGDLAVAGCETVRADISDSASIGRALDSVDAVYICIHTLSPQPMNTDRRGFMEVEKQGLKNIVEAARIRGTRRLIYVTSLGIGPDAKSAWLRERWVADQFLLGSELEVTILQSGQMIGVGAQGFDLLVRQARRRVAIGLGGGDRQQRAIDIGDLTYFLLGVLDDPRTHGRTYDVGSDDLLTNDQMLDVIAESLGRRHPAKLHIPSAIVAPFAPLADRLAKLPPGSVKGLLSSLEADMTGDTGPIRELLPRVPLTYREAVRKALVHSVDGDQRGV